MSLHPQGSTDLIPSKQDIISAVVPLVYSGVDKVPHCLAIQRERRRGCEILIRLAFGNRDSRLEVVRLAGSRSRRSLSCHGPGIPCYCNGMVPSWIGGEGRML